MSNKQQSQNAIESQNKPRQQNAKDGLQEVHCAARVQPHAAPVKSCESGWFGVGTFGEVGPAATLRQAIIRSGV